MITVSDVRLEIESDLADEVIEKIIRRVVGLVKVYTNNKQLPEDDPVLDDVYLFLVAMRVSNHMRGKQGIASESLGEHSVTFAVEMPEEVRRVLNSPIYKRAGWL